MKYVAVQLLIAGTVLLSSSGVGAEDVARVADIIVEENAEVKAIRERKESTTAKMVITRKELEELGGQTAADVLRRLPRLYLSGPPTTSKDARMAGLDKEYQNILINGNRPPGGGEKREFALDRIPVEQIERIEVLKNPDASYDADAVAGIINIILKDPPKKRSFAVTASGAMNDQAEKLGHKLTAAYGDAFGPLGVSLVGTRNDEVRSKDKSVVNTTKNQRELEDERVRTITSSINPAFTLQLGKGDKLSFKPFLTESREKKDKTKLVSNLTTGAARSRADEREDKNQFLQSYALEWDHRFSGGAALKLQGLFSRNDETKDKATANYSGASLVFSKNVFEREDKDDLEKVLGADFKLPVAGPFDTEHVLSAGVKFRDKDREVQKTVYEVNSAGVVKVTSTPNDSYQVDETITAVYLMDEAAITDKLTLLPGLRVEITDGSYVTGNGTSGSGNFVDWNPSLHARYKLPWDMVLRGSLARTISRPAFKDKVPTRSVKADKVEEGNPDLKAATSMNYEVALEKYFGNSAYVALGGFYKAVDDTIEKQLTGVDPGTGLDVYRPVNAGDAKIKGLELEVKTDLSFIRLPQVMVMGSYSLLTSRVKDVNTGVERRLKDQPNVVATMTMRYDSKPLGLALAMGLTHVGRKVNSEESKSEEPYTQWDVSARKTLYKGVSLFVSAVNIFNEKKKVIKPGVVEIEEVGRTLYAGLRFDL